MENSPIGGQADSGGDEGRDWEPGDWPQGEGPSRVIDSFLVLDGMAQRLDLHVRRTADAVAAVFGRGEGVPSLTDLGFIYLESVAQVPREGAWFPLLEVVADAERGLVLTFHARRPAPPRREVTRLALAADRRQFPGVKGADAEVTAADRAMAVDAGDDDALYVDAAGNVIEAANGAVIGWRRSASGDELVLSAHERVLPSTTVALMIGALDDRRATEELRDTATAQGFQQRPEALLPEPFPPAARTVVESFRPSDVDELWYVNALHGISPVVAVDGETRDVDAERVRRWRDTLAAWWEPV